MKNDIRKWFAELLGQMKDEKLREQVVDCWALCAQKGGWKSAEEVLQMPFTLLAPTYGVNLVEHTVAVTKGALGLYEAMRSTYKSFPFDINTDWLIAGGILHDVGKLMEAERKPDGTYKKSYAGSCARHPISGGVAAAEVGMPLEIQNMIFCHAKEGEGAPQRIETVFIHQADFATFNPCTMKDKGLLIEKK